MLKKKFLLALLSCLTTAVYAIDPLPIDPFPDEAREDGLYYQVKALNHHEEDENNLSCLCPAHEDDEDDEEDEEESNYAKCSCQDKKPASKPEPKYTASDGKSNFMGFNEDSENEKPNLI